MFSSPDDGAVTATYLLSPELSMGGNAMAGKPWEQLSHKHLPDHVAEFCFRYNN
jgi:hypothetical protein